MAPEHALGRDTDRRADIFAFGVILWEMLARRPLFTGATVSVLTRIVNEEAPSVRDVRPEVPPELEAIALKATRRNREERYATAEEMRLDLEAYLRGRSDIVSERDLARLMNDLFATIRDDVRSRIKAYVASMPALAANAAGLTGTGKLPILPTWNSPQSGSLTSWPSTPSQLEGTARSASSASASSPAAPTRRSRWPLWLFTLLLAAGGTAVFVPRSPFHWSRWLPGPIGTAVVPATAVVVAPVSAPAAPPSARVEPQASPAPVAPSAAPIVRLPGGSTPASPVSAAIAPATRGEPHRGHVAPAVAPAPPPGSVAAAVPTASDSARPNIQMLDDNESDSP
jgi:serine/threonine-protein kinase